jgi:hypothetical protein
MNSDAETNSQGHQHQDKQFHQRLHVSGFALFPRNNRPM